jgi:hypothetical protein
MMRRAHSFLPVQFLGGLGVAALCALSAGGHTLPISYLTVVPDKDYVHLELTLNPFELNFLSELERNQNGALAPVELTNREEPVARKLVNCLRLRVKGRLVAPDVAGVTSDIDSHHLTLRAHYRVDARHVPLTLLCRLVDATSGSHFTQVTYSGPSGQQLATLDQQTSSVTFTPGPAKDSAAPSPSGHIGALSGAAPWFVASAALSVVVTCSLWVTNRRLLGRVPS